MATSDFRKAPKQFPRSTGLIKQEEWIERISVLRRGQQSRWIGKVVDDKKDGNASHLLHQIIDSAPPAQPGL